MKVVGTKGWMPHLLLLVLLLLAGCSLTPPPDYTLYRNQLPRSILILPPLNSTAAIEATNQLTSTLTEPLAERGYYVFPVAVVDQLFKGKGVVSPVEVRQVSYHKLRQIFGADAVLDVTIEEWGPQFFLESGSTKVTLFYRLISLQTGDLLWSARVSRDDTNRGSNSDDDDNGIAIAIVGALVQSALGLDSEKAKELAAEANEEAFTDSHSGLLDGPRLVANQLPG